MPSRLEDIKQKLSDVSLAFNQMGVVVMVLYLILEELAELRSLVERRSREPPD